MTENTYANSGTPRLLVVDDSSENLRLLQRTLERLDYEIFVVKNPLNAMDIALKAKPDLVLLDILMPEMNGFELCGIFKENPQTKEIPIIFLTALSESEDIVKAFELGAVDYISKPFRSAEVVARIKTHITNTRLLNLLENTLKRSFHELYTPLSIIDTSVEMQVLEHGSTEYMLNIKAASRTMRNVCEDIYYSIRHEHSEYAPEKIEIKSFIQERINYFSTIAKTKSMDIVFEPLLDDKAAVYINKVELERVIDNTISNALKYGNEKSEVNMRLYHQENDGYIFEVQNVGRPIKDLNKIFTKTYREDTSALGLGLGLDIVRSICYKNKIEAEATSQDGKTIFKYNFTKLS